MPASFMKVGASSTCDNPPPPSWWVVKGEGLVFFQGAEGAGRKFSSYLIRELVGGYLGTWEWAKCCASSLKVGAGLFHFTPSPQPPWLRKSVLWDLTC